MERPLKRLLYFFAALFLALIVQLSYVQVYAAPDLKNHAANTRALDEQMRIERGVIVSADGTVIAQNRQEGDYFLREYPLGDLTAPWLGYNSLRYGRSGVERAYNPELTGETDELTARSFLDILIDKPTRGADLQLTVDLAVQRAAVDGLGERKGAVVALDPRTGQVLAMTSWPRYDPNQLDERWEELSQDADRPLVNRALQGLYPPGSSFKPVVAAAALAEGLYAPDSTFTDEGRYVAGGFPVSNYGGNIYGEHDLTTAMAKSINTSFAKMGVSLDEELLAYTRAFGFEKELPLPLESSVSTLPESSLIDTAHLAQIAFGQGQLLATPFQMALVAAGIANGGTIMNPYVVEQVTDFHGAVVEQAQPSVWQTPVSPSVAGQVAEMMVQVVERGTGTQAALPGIRVAGKTGTAQVAEGGDHAWFIGFAPADDPRVAVAVLVENAGGGGSVAAPVARGVLEAGLAR